MGRERNRAGFTLLEAMVAVGIVGVMIALSLPSFGRWQGNQRLNSSVRKVATALAEGRRYAVRTGNNTIVFFGTDTAGATLSDGSNTVDVLIVDDGRSGSANQNCLIDGGEAVAGYTLEDDVSFGVTYASAVAANDIGVASGLTSGATFSNGAGSAANWVLFQPRGAPVSMSNTCTLGALGSGGGAVYVTDSNRDSGVVLTALGVTHVYKWGDTGVGWVQ